MNFIEKINQIQVQANVPKSQYNSFGGYNYRNCEDVYEGLKPFIRDQGLILTVTDEIIHIGDRFYIKATATISDGEQSYSTVGYAREAESKKGLDVSQVTGAASSYARKYALQGLFALDDNKDADETNTHGSEQSGASGSGQRQGQGSRGSGGQNQGRRNNSGSGSQGKPQSQDPLSQLPQIGGVQFELVTGKDQRQYVIAKGDTYNKKNVLKQYGFSTKKDSNQQWVTFLPVESLLKEAA
jgi:hypothetical protein